MSRMQEISGVANGGGLNASRVSTMANGRGEGQRVVNFQLSPSCELKIQQGDITKWFVDSSSDAIVNPANERMVGGGGGGGDGGNIPTIYTKICRHPPLPVSAVKRQLCALAIHRAAGPELLAACYNIPEVRRDVRCPTGEARITPGFGLPSSHVVHTAGPIYDVDSNPEASLRNAYRNSLRVAKEKNIQYIAFPAISCGVYGYPYDEAATVAVSSVREFANDFKEVHFVLFEDDVYNAWLNKANELLRD